MIVLDTNVLSELMRAEASPAVLEWLGAPPQSDLFTTAVSQAEVLHGLALLPAGRRRKALTEAADHLFEDFGGRVLAFDSRAAQAYAELVAARRAAGRPIAFADGQIAAIVRASGGRLATRNTRDFEHCGIEVIDP